MSSEGNADGKWSEKKMGQDGLRTVETVECLRGRLLAERVASKTAKEEADQIGNKLIELETKLKEEIKARNRADKMLRFLMRKLESINVSYVSDESEQSCASDRVEMSSVSSSTGSSRTKEPEANHRSKVQITDSAGSNAEESTEDVKFSNIQANTNHSVSHIRTFKHDDDAAAAEKNSSSANEANAGEVVARKCEMEDANKETSSLIVSDDSERKNVQDNKLEKGPESPLIEGGTDSSTKVDSDSSSMLEFNQSFNESKTSDHRSEFSVNEELIRGESDEDKNDHFNNSMALVPVDLPKQKQTLDPEVLDATTKEVLESLRHARERLQSTMERRRMIRVG